MRLVILHALLLAAAIPALTAEPMDLVAQAQAAVRAEALGRPAPAPAGRSPVRPVFVTIERGGRVIGCRGSMEPRGATLEAAVVAAARAAAAHDPRYAPISAADLPSLLVTVTVVDRLEPIASVDGLVPADGLVLRAAGKTGVVLPWEGKDPRVRLEWAYRKAGVAEGSACSLYRMKAERWRG